MILTWSNAFIAGTACALLYVLPPIPDHSSKLLSADVLRWTEGIRQKYDIPSISIGVIASPKWTGDCWLNETHALGHMDLAGRPVDEDTLFVLGSNSKLFAAIAIGLLIENNTLLDNGNQLGYDTKIKDILPDWQLQDTYMRDHLDLVDLLAMRSGLLRHDKSYSEETASDIVRRVRHLRPSTEVRQVMQYNSIHYFIIGEIVAYLTKDTYHTYIQTHILDLLGMAPSYYNYTLAIETGQMAQSFVRTEVNTSHCAEVWLERDELDTSCYGRPFPVPLYAKGDGLFLAAVGGLASSTADMMVWLKELLEPTVVPANIIDETHKSLIPAWGETVEFDEVSIESYGLAQMTFNYRGHEVIHHTGDVPGFATHIARLPKLGVGIFVGYNDDKSAGLVSTTIIYRLLDDLLGLDPIDWEERLITRRLRGTSSLTPIPDDQRPAPPITSLTGRYRDDGYGSLEVVAFDGPHRFDQSLMSSFAPGTKVQSYIAAIYQVTTTMPGLSEPLLVAHAGKLFVSTYIFTHFDGPIFNVTMIDVKQNPIGELTAYATGSSSAVFVDGEGGGFGMFENFWGGRYGKRAVEEGIQKDAEVWFSKAHWNSEGPSCI